MKTNFLHEIEQIINWYYALPPDYSSVKDLIYKRQRLVGLYNYLTSSSIKAKQNLSDSIHITEQSIIKSRHYHASCQPAIKSLMSKLDSLPEIKAEKAAASKVKSYELKIKSIKEILSVMNQHISYLKTEQLNIHC